MLKLLDLLVKLLLTIFTTKWSQEPQEPIWLRNARDELGFHETGVNEGIEHLIASAKCGAIRDPWCSVFCNSEIEQAGLRGTRNAMARSFESSEHFVKLTGPALGAIVTMWRKSKNSGLGHVFFYTGHDADGNVWGIGGNENDGVRHVPHDASRIVGYYWPKSIPLPSIGPIRVNSTGRISTKEV